MHTDSESVAGSHHQEERSPPELSTPELMQICNNKVAWRQGAALMVVIVVIVVVLVFSQTFCLKFSKKFALKIMFISGVIQVYMIST